MFTTIPSDARKIKTYNPPLGIHWLTPAYDLITSVTGFGKRYKRRVLHSISLRGDETVLDVGCGTGVLLEVIKTDYPRIDAIGIDPDLRSLEMARKRLAQGGLQAELKQAFAESLPLADDSVDVAFSTLAFHHINNEAKGKACTELFRVLKKGGRVVISDFYRPKILGPTTKEIRVAGETIEESLQRAGFQHVRLLWRRVPLIQTIAADK